MDEHVRFLRAIKQLTYDDVQINRNYDFSAQFFLPLCARDVHLSLARRVGEVALDVIY